MGRLRAGFLGAEKIKGGTKTNVTTKTKRGRKTRYDVNVLKNCFLDIHRIYIVLADAMPYAHTFRR